MRLRIMGIYNMHTKKFSIKNQIHYHCENLIKPKLKTRKIFIHKKSYKDRVNYVTWYNTDKSITMLNLYYVKLIGKIEETEGKNTW